MSPRKQTPLKAVLRPLPLQLQTLLTPLHHIIDSYDQCSSADTQVGIGLSLLQDLANGMDSSDEEQHEYDDVRRRLGYSRWSVHSSGLQGR